MDDPMSIFWMAFEDLKVGSKRYMRLVSKRY